MKGRQTVPSLSGEREREPRKRAPLGRGKMKGRQTVPSLSGGREALVSDPKIGGPMPTQ